jgi:hypothetical protein
LTVSFYGKFGFCTTDVQLAIINFDISPPETLQKASILKNQTTQVIWVLKPKSQGKFSYAVFFPDDQTRSPDVSTVTVTNDIGLPAWVTSILVPVAVAALGPLLTVPYWIDKYSAWIKKRKTQNSSEKDTKKSQEEMIMQRWLTVA